jgi:tetratricopeptide (TPR) repeat protein
MLPGEPRTLLEGGVAGPEAYERDEEWQKRVVEHCRFNLNRMVDIAHAAGAKVIFVTPASNLRDCSPFKSQNRAGLTPAEFKNWQSFVAVADRAYSAGDWNAALAAADRALTIDDQHAGVHYLRGRALWQMQRFDEARKEFIQAKDQDICPLRALTSIVNAVQDVAAQRRVPVADFVEMIDQLAEHRTPGDDWFLDHVHPTIDGNFRLASALVPEIARTGFGEIDRSWDDAAAHNVKRQVEARLDRKTHGTALCNVAKVMAWAGKYEDAYRSALRAESLSPNDAAIEFEVGKNAYHLRRYDEAIQHLKAALALNPRFVEAQLLLANSWGAQGDFAQAIVACRAGLELRPSDAGLHLTLGHYDSRVGQTNEAIAQVREAIRLAPDYAEAHSNLGWLLKDSGQLTEALEHFREAVRLKPGLITARLGLAWLLASHPDERLRDPRRAIALSEQMADGSHFENWMVLDTLAVSYAAAGRFDDAVHVQQQAVNLVHRNSPAYESAVQQRLVLFQQGKPYRENAR